MRANRLYEFGGFCLNPAERRLLRDGEAIALTPKCFDLLVILVENSGHLLDKETLLDRVWPEQFVEEANLSFQISTLRKALGEGQGGRRFIETVPKKGFRFVPAVEARWDEEASATVTNENELSSANIPDAQRNALTAERPFALTESASTPAKGRSRATNLLLILLPVAVVGVFGYLLFSRNKPATPYPSVASIAVLPLENLSGDPAQEYFADGMTDALISDLARIGELRVISRTSSMHYKATKKSLPEIALELNVDAVVEGTIQRSGDRVLVRAQLVHAPTDRHLWTETYERDLRDVLSMQSEIAQTIAREVQIKLSAADHERLARRREVNPKAFDLYLQGRYLYWTKRNEENLRKAISYFENATKEDPNYALAYAALADSYNAIGAVQIGSFPPLEMRSRAEQAAKKALELDGSLAEAHSALAFVNNFNWNWVEAEQEFKRAIELNPNYANAHSFYAAFLVSRGRVDEAIATVNRARELDPFSLSISIQRGFFLENARRYDEAIEQFQQITAVDQNNYQAHWMLGHTYAAAGRFKDAIAEAEKAVSLSDRGPGALGILGMVYGSANRKDDARKILQELLDLNKRHYVSPAAVGWVYIGLGDKDKAFAWLEKAYQERSYYLAYFKTVPVSDPLREDPRFADLARRIGLPE